MVSRIERLKVCAFRGATTELVIEFDPEKPVTMIFGENGTGKSTIVDAIGFVCTQNWRGFYPRLSRLIDLAPLMPPFLLNSIDLILHEHLREALFQLKEAPTLARR
jgi:hypothetical protein